jgi:hypothetical protein
MIGHKLLWTGLALILALSKLWVGLPWDLIGEILMIIGLILFWLDKKTEVIIL